MNKLTLIANAGRSGSTFIEHLLRANYSNECYIAHEDIPVQVSKPRLYNRAYESSRVQEILSDKILLNYLDVWKNTLEDRPIVESGWTAYHLLPVLKEVFGDQFQYVIMHRDPVSVSFSRANMGNYHRCTFYDDAHEVSPFDPYSIAPQKRELWPSMNHFEKCMYWWWVVYLEAYEFKEKNPEIPCMEIASKDVFSFKRTDELLVHIGLDPQKLKVRDVPKNELAKFMRESFPVREEWKSWKCHEDIIKFAETLGYEFDEEAIRVQADKYTLPRGIGPKLRNSLNYWRLKSRLAGKVRGLFIS